MQVSNSSINQHRQQRNHRLNHCGSRIRRVNSNNAYSDISHRYWNTGRNESQKLNPREPTHRVRVTCKIKLFRITFRCSSMDDVKASKCYVSDMCMQCKVGKESKFWNRYNQVPYMTQDTIWESEKYTKTLDTREIQESQEVSHFLAGDHKAA